MSENWNYSNLSSRAKEAGGPDALLREYYKDGAQSMIPTAVITGIIGLGIGYNIRSFISKRCEKRCQELDIPDKDIQTIEQIVKDGDADESEEYEKMKSQFTENRKNQEEDNEL